MLNLSRICIQDRLMRAVTGLTVKQFDDLIDAFEKAHIKAIDADRRERGCIRKKGAGQKPRLATPRLRLLFILFYVKCYPTYDVLGVLFDLDKGNCCDWVKHLLPILETALGKKHVLPARKIRSVEEFFQLFPNEKDLLIDGTKRRTQRSKNPRAQRKHRSGKQGCQTRKNLLMVNLEKKVLFLSPTKAGRYHDKKMFDKETSFRCIPPERDIWVDKGFQGLQHTHQNVMMPKKRTKNQPLTDAEKEQNRLISSLRMPVENAIAGIKRFNCLRHVYRNRKGQDDQFIFLGAGLWNFNLECR